MTAPATQPSKSTGRAPMDPHRPRDVEDAATPPVACSRFGYTAADGTEYEIAVFHRGAGGGRPADGADADAATNQNYGRLEREHEAGLRTDPYAGVPWLEAAKLVMRERRGARAWRGYGHATLLHRDALPATGWHDAVRRRATATTNPLHPGRAAADPCAELAAFALAHLVGDDDAVTAATAAGTLRRRRGQFRDAAAAAAFDGSRLVHAHRGGDVARRPPGPPLRPLVVVERFLVYPGAWRRGLGRAAFDALAATLFGRLRRPWAFVARPSCQRAEAEAYLAELGATVPLAELRRAPVAFWAALGFRPFRHTAWVYNLGRPVFAPVTSPVNDVVGEDSGDDDNEGTLARPSAEGETLPPSSDDKIVVLLP